MKNNLTDQLEKKLKNVDHEQYRERFNQWATYKGNGIYQINNRFSTDTRELFLMFVADMEGIEFKTK